MKPQPKTKDDSLFGLLSSYKFNNTYIRVLISDDDDRIAVLLTDNPGNWKRIENPKYSQYKELSRLEIGCSKLSIKYLNPRQIIMIRGEMLGIKLPASKTKVIDRLEEYGYYIVETSLKYKNKVLNHVNNLLKTSPQKKYEIIEKCISICLDSEKNPDEKKK